jgi:hypothetical protein
MYSTLMDIRKSFVIDQGKKTSHVNAALSLIRSGFPKIVKLTVRTAGIRYTASIGTRVEIR